MSHTKTKYPLTTIGLELHVQLKLASKLLSSAPVPHSDSPPNSCVAAHDIGLPGIHPMLNKKAIKLAVIAGEAFNCKINQNSSMSRKHYNCIDLPLGFQTTQVNKIAEGGFVKLSTGRKIRLEGIHIETDAAKVRQKDNVTYVDYNRSGVSLVEIVSKPDISSKEEAIETIRNIQQTLRITGVSRARMEMGEFRVDVNVSFRGDKDDPLGVRTEIKNLNSYKSIGDAIDCESKKQNKFGRPKYQYSARFDIKTNQTVVMRHKENAEDYRPSREYNIPTIKISDEFIQKVRSEMPELPPSIFKRFKKFSTYKVISIMIERDLIPFVDCFKKSSHKKRAINLLSNELINYAETEKVRISTMYEYNFIKLINMIESGLVSYAVVKKHLLPQLFRPEDIALFIDKNKLRSINSISEIRSLIEKAKKKDPDLFDRLSKGEKKLIGPIKGKVISLSGGLINIAELTKEIEKISQIEIEKIPKE